MTVPFCLLRAHLMMWKDMNWLLKCFISEPQKLIDLKLLKKTPKFLWFEPKAFHVLWNSSALWDLKAVRATKILL